MLWITWSIHPVSPSRPARRIGRPMLARALSVGTRLNDWNTMPIRSRRSTVRSWSSRVDSSWSPMKAEPEVSESRPAVQCSSVDLPDPDGPMMAVNSPVGNATVTPSRARTSVTPLP